MTCGRGAVGLLFAPLLLACGEEAPRSRGDTRPRDAGWRGPEDAAAKPYDGSCGGETCPSLATFARPCCTRRGTGEAGHELENVGRTADRCGANLEIIVPSLTGICLEVDQPGTRDRQCPAQVSIEGGAARPGCCTDEGFCGSLDPVIPLGCFYATGLKGRRCQPGSDEDAGVP